MSQQTMNKPVIERIVPRGHDKLGLKELQEVIDSILESPFHAQTLRSIVIERLRAVDPNTRHWAVKEVYRFEDLVTKYKPEIYSDWLESQEPDEAEQAEALRLFNEAINSGSIVVEATSPVAGELEFELRKAYRKLRQLIRGDVDYMRRHIQDERLGKLLSINASRRASLNELNELIEAIAPLRKRLNGERATRARQKAAEKAAREEAKAARRAEQSDRPQPVTQVQHVSPEEARRLLGNKPNAQPAHETRKSDFHNGQKAGGEKKGKPSGRKKGKG